MTRTKPRETEASALACDIVADAFGQLRTRLSRVGTTGFDDSTRVGKRNGAPSPLFSALSYARSAPTQHLRSSRCQQAILVMIRHNSIRIM